MNRFYMTIANAAGPDVADKEHAEAFNTLAKHFADARPDRIEMFLDSRCGKLIAEMVLVGYSVAVQLDACPDCMERRFRRIIRENFVDQLVDKRYVDVRLGETFKPNARSAWMTKTTNELRFRQEGVLYNFYEHSLVLVPNNND